MYDLRSVTFQVSVHGGGGEENCIFLSHSPRSLFSHARFARELTDVFEKSETKTKTTSVYRLAVLWPPTKRPPLSIKHRSEISAAFGRTKFISAAPEISASALI